MVPFNNSVGCCPWQAFLSCDGYAVWKNTTERCVGRYTSGLVYSTCTRNGVTKKTRPDKTSGDLATCAEETNEAGGTNLGIGCVFPSISTSMAVFFFCRFIIPKRSLRWCQISKSYRLHHNEQYFFPAVHTKNYTGMHYLFFST